MNLPLRFQSSFLRVFEHAIYLLGKIRTPLYRDSHALRAKGMSPLSDHALVDI